MLETCSQTYVFGFLLKSLCAHVFTLSFYDFNEVCTDVLFHLKWRIFHVILVMYSENYLIETSLRFFDDKYKFSIITVHYCFPLCCRWSWSWVLDKFSFSWSSYFYVFNYLKLNSMNFSAIFFQNFGACTINKAANITRVKGKNWK